MAFNIKYNSKPVYDSFGTADYWGCVEWVRWYNELEAFYGNDKAEKIWSDAWLDGLSVAGGGRGIAVGSGYVFDSVPIDCRSFNNQFISFLDEHPNLNAVVRKGIAGLITRPISIGSEVVSGIVSGVSSGVKALKYIVPLVLVGGLIGIMYWSFRKVTK